MNVAKLVSFLLPVILVILSIPSYFFFKNIFLTTSEQASILTALPLLLAGALLHFKTKIQTYIENIVIHYTKRDTFFLCLTLMAMIATYVSIVAIILLGNPIVVRDEWRHLNDYLFNKDLWHSVFDRQNGHLIVTTNILYLINYYLFSSKEIWLHLLNIILIMIEGILMVRVLYSAIYDKLNKTIVVASCSILFLCWWWLAGGLSMFWALGIHNNLASLGVITVACGLSVYGITSKKGLLYFLVGSTFASISFSAGIASWGLGFIAVILNKGDLKKLLTSILISLVGVGVIMGGHFFRIGGLRGMTKTGGFDFSLIEFLKFIPTFLGAPFTQFFYTDIDITSLTIPYLSLGIGILSLVHLIIQVGFYFRKSSSLSIAASRSLRFFFLMMAFVIGSGILFGLGRTEGSFANALAWRFHSWGVIYWCSLLASTIIIYASINSIYSDKVYGLFLGFVLIGLVLYNAVRIEVRLYENNKTIPALVDLIVHPNKEGNEKNLWNPKVPTFPKIINEVSNRLKVERKNLYAEQWTHLMRQKFSEAFPFQKNDTLNASLYFKTLESDNDIAIEGWVWSNSSTYLSPSKIVFVLKDQIIGIGIPSSDRKLSKLNSNKPTDIASLSNFFHLLPRPFRNLPGVSNYFYGQILLKDKTKQNEVKIFGIYNNGQYARILLF